MGGRDLMFFWVSVMPEDVIECSENSTAIQVQIGG